MEHGSTFRSCMVSNINTLTYTQGVIKIELMDCLPIPAPPVSYPPNVWGLLKTECS